MRRSTCKRLNRPRACRHAQTAAGTDAQARDREHQRKQAVRKHCCHIGSRTRVLEHNRRTTCRHERCGFSNDACVRVQRWRATPLGLRACRRSRQASRAVASRSTASAKAASSRAQPAKPGPMLSRLIKTPARAAQGLLAMNAAADCACTHSSRQRPAASARTTSNARPLAASGAMQAADAGAGRTQHSAACSAPGTAAPLRR